MRKFFISVIIGFMIFVLISCGGEVLQESDNIAVDDVENNEIEIGENAIEIDSASKYNIDLTRQIYLIDPELYDTETEQEYKEAFYLAITNQLPLEYLGGRDVYFRDYFQDIYDLNNLKYCFIDCDGDGLPELAIDGFSKEGLCILKYTPGEGKVLLYYKGPEGCVLLGSNQIGYSKQLSQYVEWCDYWTLDAEGKVEQVIWFEKNRNNQYIINGYYTEQEIWEKVANDFSALMEHPIEMLPFSVVFGEAFSPALPDDTEYYYQWLHEGWSTITDEWDIPYADEDIFETIKNAYAEISFEGEFILCNSTLQEEYKKIFLKLLNNEVSFLNEETGEEIYLKNYEDLTGGYDLDITTCTYRFFDIDGDGMPELGIRNDAVRSEEYYFQYNAETGKIVLWYAMLRNWETWFGSQKWAEPANGFEHMIFIQFGKDGEAECETHSFSIWHSEEIQHFMIMLPNYADETREIEVTQEMMNQGVFSRTDDQWYFRLTEEQYDEVTAAYKDAYYSTRETIHDITYTYEELFGPYTQNE